MDTINRAFEVFRSGIKCFHFFIDKSECNGLKTSNGKQRWVKGGKGGSQRAWGLVLRAFFYHSNLGYFSYFRQMIGEGEE
jgi:hypothetical protein